MTAGVSFDCGGAGAGLSDSRPKLGVAITNPVARKQMQGSAMDLNIGLTSFPIESLAQLVSNSPGASVAG